MRTTANPKVGRGSAVVGADRGRGEGGSAGLALCAERSAVAQAVAAGVTKFRAIAIVAGTTEAVPPCGMCRQVLAEFAHAMPVRSYTPRGALLESTVATLLPHGFSGAFLDG